MRPAASAPACSTSVATFERLDGHGGTFADDDNIAAIHVPTRVAVRDLATGDLLDLDGLPFVGGFKSPAGWDGEATDGAPTMEVGP